MSVSVCPTREQLHNYAVGRMSDEQSDAVADHLDDCDACQARIATFDDADDTLVSQLQHPPDDDPVVGESQCELALARARNLADSSEMSRVDFEQATESRVGRRLGEYQLMEELGRGGMGRVYKALQTKLDRVVALKVLPGSRLDDQRAIARFEREMRAIGKLDHANIVHAYDAREIDGKPVLVMEFVEGLDLGRVVQCCGQLRTADACELARQAAVGLQYAHENDLVHRDVKPSNLMLTPQGKVKILDLGLARFQTTPSAGDEMTGIGQPMGTADYMAPEQVSDSRAADIRADIYGLGCTLYKLLTGHAPFSGPDQRCTFDKLTAHVHEPAPSIREHDTSIPADLATLLDRMLAKSPEDRPATPGEVAAEIEPFCTGHDLAGLESIAEEEARQRRENASGVPPRPLKPPRPGSRDSMAWSPFESGWWWGLVAGLVILVAATGFAMGVIITIKRNGKETRVEVPDGSKVAINEKGDMDVALPDSKKSSTAPTSGDPNTQATTASRRTDHQALEGAWKVVDRQGGSPYRSFIEARKTETGNGRSVLSPSAFLEFVDGRVRVRGESELPASYKFQINPDTSPKMIDLTVDGEQVKGVYEIDDNQLKVCFDWKEVNMVASKGTRPEAVWAGLHPYRELLVLERVGPAVIYPDERAILGSWELISASLKIEDPGPQFSAPAYAAPRGTLEKGRRIVITGDRFTICRKPSDARPPEYFPHGWHIQPSPVDDTYRYAMDPTEGRKNIAFTDGMGKPCRGIYDISGDRLAIRLGRDARPKDMESPDGEVLLRLKRVVESGEDVALNPPRQGRSAAADEPASARRVGRDPTVRSSVPARKTDEPAIIVRFDWLRPTEADADPNSAVEIAYDRRRSFVKFLTEPKIGASFNRGLEILAERLADQRVGVATLLAPWDMPESHLHELNSLFVKNGFSRYHISLPEGSRPPNTQPATSAGKQSNDTGASTQSGVSTAKELANTALIAWSQESASDKKEVKGGKKVLLVRLNSEGAMSLGSDKSTYDFRSGLDQLKTRLENPAIVTVETLSYSGFSKRIYDDLAAVLKGNDFGIFKTWPIPPDRMGGRRDASAGGAQRPATKHCAIHVDTQGRFWLNNDQSEILEGEDGFARLRANVIKEPVTYVDLFFESGTPTHIINQFHTELQKSGVRGFNVRMLPRKTPPARLDFRICATRHSDDLPGLKEAEIRRYEDQFTGAGIGKVDEQPSPDYIWVEFEGEPRENLIVNSQLYKNYVLVSTAPKSVMLSTDTGDRAWRIKGVTATRDQTGRPAIEVWFDKAGGLRLGELSQSHLRRALAVILDDKAIVAPIIHSKITDRVRITGNLDQKKVDRIVKSLSANLGAGPQK